jgi:hypothetical protein
VSIFDRKLSDLTVGDVAKGYAVYWVVGSIAALIVGGIGIAMVTSASHEAEKSMGLGFGGFDAPENRTLETSPSVHKVTRTEYRALETGTTKEDVVKRFGKPGGTGPDISDTSGSGSEDCLTYSRARSTDKSYLFCFDGRKILVSKRGI